MTNVSETNVKGFKDPCQDSWVSAKSYQYCSEFVMLMSAVCDKIIYAQ